MSYFKDITVLELASVLAGPSVGQFFAELGADVIKVENHKTGGDVTRTWKGSGEQTDDRSAYFCSVNWGKRSIAVDLSTDEGREIVYGLARVSDVVLASYKPGDAQKLRVDYETLSAIHPKIIYGQITGYGSANPRVGYDAIIQAESGFMFMNGEPGRQSLKIPVALMDVLAGHQLKEAILIAMLERTNTSQGKLVEVSLIQSAIASLVNQATNWLIGGKAPAKQGSAHPNIAPYGDVFKTSDGKELLLAIGSDRQFADLCGILRTNAHEDQRYKTNVKRVENRGSLNAMLAPLILQHGSEELTAAINKAKIPAGLIQDVPGALEMPEAKEMIIESGGLRGLRSFAGTPIEQRSHFLPPPRMGQHSDEILVTRLKYSPEMIQALRSTGVIV